MKKMYEEYEKNVFFLCATIFPGFVFIKRAMMVLSVAQAYFKAAFNNKSSVG